MNTKILSTTENDITLAGKIIKNGGLVAFPTETVYGLGANALDENAVKKIFAAKGRPGDNPLIVHIAEKADVYSLVENVTPKAAALIEAFFPAPLTIILKKSSVIPNAVSAGLDTVAVRMPQNETARRLIKAAGCPIAAPSANTSGLPSPTKAKYVINDMNSKIDAIIDGGDCEYGVESTVISLAQEIPVILRPGAVTKEMLEEVIGRVEISSAVLGELKQGETAASPGMKYKHYSPSAKVIIVKADKKQYGAFLKNAEKVNKILYSKSYITAALCFEDDEVSIPFVSYGTESDPLSQAKELFSALRQLDEMGAGTVYARMPSSSGVGMAVYNRLIRAAAFNIIDLEKPFFIGLTGQTGAGKSLLCELSLNYGFTVIDSDVAARRVVNDGSSVLSELCEKFGQDIIDGKELNRKKLAEIAFSSKEKTDELNKIMHPAIAALCRREALEKCKNGFVILDAPQLFEAGLENDCGKIISVTASKESREKRIIERDGLTPLQAEQRINAQYDESFFKEHSDFVIENSGEKTELKPQFEEILKIIL